MMNRFIKANTIIILTALSYCVALSYERGYSKVFNYPFDMISIDIKSLFVAISGSVAFIFLMGMVSIVGAKIMIRKGFSSLLIMLCVSIIFYLIAFFSPFNRTITIMILLLCAAICIPGIYGMLLNIENHRKQLLKKIAKTSVLAFWDFGFALISFYYLSFIVVILTIGMAIGTFMASSQNTFYTFQFNSNKYAIIKQYDTNIITAKIVGNKLSSDITYFTSDKLSGLELKLEKGIEREKPKSKGVEG